MQARQPRLLLQNRTRLMTVAMLALIVGLLIVHHFVEAVGVFPEDWNFGLREPIEEFKIWTIRNKSTHWMFTYFFSPLSDGIDYTLEQVETALLWLPWPVVLAGIFLLSQRIANLRVALLATGCTLAMGLLGLWDESMETLSLMVISVIISLVIGVPLGVWAGQDSRVDAVLRPFLDAMQTMPAFVYFIPVLLFFGTALVPSVVATVVYALPPAVRLTSLGIRQVSPAAIEAARSFGSTPRQILFKVKLPMALPTIMAGVNQTIMMALGIVVIASLIGAGGLGKEVLFALRRVRVGQALEAGLAIVVMAILLDRVSYAFSQMRRSSRGGWQGYRLFSERLSGLAPISLIESGLDAVYRAGGWVTSRLADGLHRLIPMANRDVLKGMAYWLLSLAVLGALTWGAIKFDPLRQETEEQEALTVVDFPEGWNVGIREPVDEAVTWMQTNLYEEEVVGVTIGTGPFSDFVILKLLNPLRDFLLEWLSWPVFMLIVFSIAYAVADWRLAAASVVGLFAIGGLGMWEDSMDTLSQIIVAVLLSVVIGVPLGIASARSTLVESIVRPVMDFLQTIPPFVYLVPVIMLFNLGRVPGIMASVLYALPPAVRLTSLGIRQVEASAVEAASAFGSTSWQTLRKVQLPLALPAIMLGINQTIMMVLAMVIVAGLVGGGGLGFEVVSGLAQNEIGRALEAGLAIVILAIILDRITQALAERQKQAANLEAH